MESTSAMPRKIQSGDYKFVTRIGNGTYGMVAKVIENSTGQELAIKKFMDLSNGDAMKQQEAQAAESAEIENLFSVQGHENVVRLKEVVVASENPSSCMMVMEYVDFSVAQLLKFPFPLVKECMQQLLQGLAHCHERGVAHLDVKPHNVLISTTGQVKLADFGSSMRFPVGSSGRSKLRSPDCVGTLVYQAPELLMGSPNYGPEADVWSAGCMFAQLLATGITPLFQGKTVTEVLRKIIKWRGSLTESTWPGVSQLPRFNLKVVQATQGKHSGRRLRRVFEELVEREAVDLLDKMLTLDPAKRISAKEALYTSYFTAPSPTTATRKNACVAGPTTATRENACVAGPNGVACRAALAGY